MTAKSTILHRFSNAMSMKWMSVEKTKTKTILLESRINVTTFEEYIADMKDEKSFNLHEHTDFSKARFLHFYSIFYSLEEPRITMEMIISFQ